MYKIRFKKLIKNQVKAKIKYLISKVSNGRAVILFLIYFHSRYLLDRQFLINLHSVRNHGNRILI